MLNHRNQMNFSTDPILTTNKRIVSEKDLNVTFAAVNSAAVLGVGYPVGFNESTGNHAPWMAPDASILVVDIASRTGGTWGMTVNSLVIANTVFAWNVAAAVVQEALRVAGFNATVVLDTKIYTITFSDEAQIKVIPATLEGDVTALTGGSADATATETAGTSSQGTHNIRGFIHPNDLAVGTKTGSVTLSRVTTLATATQATPHGLVTGMSLTMSGADNAAFNVTADITVTTPFSYTYAVADSGATTDAGAYTTTNQEMVIIMVKGQIAAEVPQALVAVGDVTALNTALKNDLIERGIIVQGLAGRN